MTPENISLVAGLILAALPLGLIFWLGQLRVPYAMKNQEVLKQSALRSDHYPDRMTQISNAFANQFELPILFYVALAAGLYLGVDWIFATLAVCFTGARYAHAFVHTGSNKVTLRFQLYTIGLFNLCAIWLWLAYKLILTMAGN